jgi:hypothetical protein
VSPGLLPENLQDADEDITRRVEELRSTSAFRDEVEVLPDEELDLRSHAQLSPQPSPKSIRDAIASMDETQAEIVKALAYADELRDRQKRRSKEN